MSYHYSIHALKIRGTTVSITIPSTSDIVGHCEKHHQTVDVVRSLMCTTGNVLQEDSSTKRHVGIKAVVAKMMASVEYVVQIDPALQLLTCEVLQRLANSDDEGRLDI